MILISFSVKIPIYIFHFLIIKNIIEVPYYTVLIIILPSAKKPSPYAKIRRIRNITIVYIYTINNF